MCVLSSSFLLTHDFLSSSLQLQICGYISIVIVFHLSFILKCYLLEERRGWILTSSQNVVLIWIFFFNSSKMSSMLL